MGVTLKQIAEMAGVHKSTVDKVIHNRPGVSEAKRKMIRDLLDEYGYESNPLAKALNYQKRKMKVVVIIPDVDAAPFLRQGMELVQQDFNSFNIDVEYKTVSLADYKGQASFIRSLKEEGVSGVVLMPLESAEVTEAALDLQESGIPIITLNSDMESIPALCHVGTDMKQAGRTAARVMTLLKPEGAVLGVISGTHMKAIKQREKAFVTYLPTITSNMELKEPMIIEETPESAYQNTVRYLEEHPDMNALFITCGEIDNICRAVKDLGRTDDMTVLCYERYPAIVELLQRGEIAATISSDLRDQGRLAMRLLFEYLIYERQPKDCYMPSRSEIFLKENI